MSGLKLMIVCGEPSGDLLGAQLMSSLRAETGEDLAFCGVGGDAMAAGGFQSLFPLSETSVMGIVEIVPRIAAILRLIRRTAEFAVAEKPDAVILIDSPEFTQRVARRIHRLRPEIPLITYVAPQVWAMRPGRAKKMASYLSLMLALLPFEPPIFEKHGLKTVFVGHPAVERGARMVGGDAFRSRHGIAADAPLLALLPGSRSGEVKYLMPVFRETLLRLAGQVPGLTVVLPLAAHVAGKVCAACDGLTMPCITIEGEAEKFAAFDAADVALAASGTVTTELALARTPTVVAYKVHPLTAAVVRRLIRVRFATLTNLILDREAMPEFIQENCTSDKLTAAVARLLADPAAAAAQAAAQTQAMTAMGLGGPAPSTRAARAVLDFLRR